MIEEEKKLEIEDFEIYDLPKNVKKHVNGFPQSALGQKVLNMINKLKPLTAFKIPVALFEGKLKTPENSVRNLVKKYEKELQKKELEASFRVAIIKDDAGKVVFVEIKRIL